MGCIEGYCATAQYSSFQNSNGQFEPFILFSILICVWRPNFTFSGIFFTISLDLLKIAVFYGPDLLKTAIFNKSKKIVKKFQKM